MQIEGYKSDFMQGLIVIASTKCKTIYGIPCEGSWPTCQEFRETYYTRQTEWQVASSHQSLGPWLGFLLPFYEKK
jgi:hypothetical protein